MELPACETRDWTSSCVHGRPSRDTKAIVQSAGIERFRAPWRSLRAWVAVGGGGGGRRRRFDPGGGGLVIEEGAKEGVLRLLDVEHGARGFGNAFFDDDD